MRTAASLATAPAEWLESRCYLSVGLDGNGWTVVTPSADSQIWYVSSSTGSDTNSGTSPSSPFKTIAKAQSKMRKGYPDELLLKRGDTFTTNVFVTGGGRSADEPMLYSNYGDPTLPRPVLDATTSIALNLGNSTSYFDVIGIDFTSSTHDPTSSNFSNKGSFGIQDLGASNSILIEDCRFRNFTTGANFQANLDTTPNAPITNITFRRNEVVDVYSTNGNPQGIFAYEVNGLTLQDNIFDHDGWSTLVPGAGATQFYQDVYLHSSCNNVVATDNIFSNAGSTGLQARCGGVVDNNLFISDPTGLTFGVVNGSTTRAGGVTGEVIGNVFLKSRDISGSPVGLGALLGNLTPGGNVQMTNNLFEEDTQGVNAAIQFEPGAGDSNGQQEVGLNTLTVQNNIVRNWGYGMYVSNSYIPGSTGPNALNGLVVKNNDFQGTISTKIINQDALYDPRYEDWSGNRYTSNSPQSGWFKIQGTILSLTTWKTRVEPSAAQEAVPYVDGTRDLEAYMASLGLTNTQDAYLAAVRGMSKGNWNFQLMPNAVNSWIESGYVVDSAPPTALLAPPPDITNDNNPTQTFSVTYTDNFAINNSTITNGNLIVTGPNGFSAPATLISSSGGSGSTINATYQITAPGGTWTSLANGTYIVALAGGQVKDISGNAMPAQNLGSFRIALTSSGAVLGPTTPTNFAMISANASGITLGWSDSAGDQSSFVLRRADNSGFTTNVVSFPILGSATSYTDATAASGKTYYYQLVAVNSSGQSAPTPTVSAAILPPIPALSSTIFNDGLSTRTTMTAATLFYSQPVTVDATDIGLVVHGTNTAISTSVANPTGDGKTWIISFNNTGGINGTLQDGTYDLNIHNSQITDAFGQNAGADQVKTFSVDVAPRVLSGTFSDSAPPHSLSFTFSKDVSATLSASTLVLSGGSGTGTYPAVSNYSWNPSTLTATWTYNGAFNDSANTYTATLSAATVKDAGGVQLDGNGDGIAGDNYTFNFKQLKPSITLSGTSPVMVNTAFTLTYGTVVDAGQTVTNYKINWGDGTNSNFTTTGTASHTYTTAATYTITADLTDGNGVHTNCGSMNLQVNRALVSLAGNNANANVNGIYTLNLGTVTDPGQTPTSYTVHWGDGSAASTASSGPFTHTYTTTGSRTITVDLTDGAGTVTTAGTFKASVNNSPTDYITGNLNANQGGTYRLVVNSPTDTGYTVTGYLIHWGDGTTSNVSAAGAYTHVYTATGTDTLSLDLTDSTGTFVGAGGKLTLKVNPPPTIALSGSATDNEGDIYTLNLGAVTDPGQTVSQYTVHWGDGTGSVFTSGGPVSHIFQASGNLNITVDLTDGTGTFAAAGTLAVQVNAAQSLTITANDPSDSFYLKLDPNGTSFDLWQNSPTPGSGTPDFILSTSTSLTIQCTNGNDSLTVDEAAGIINLPGGLTFNASAGGASSMTIIGTSASEVLAVNNANASFGASTINYANVGSVIYNDGNGNDTINVNGAIPVTVNLGTGNDTLNLATGANATVNMYSTGDVTINGSGNVTINIGSNSGNISSGSSAILVPTTATNFGTPLTTTRKPIHKKPTHRTPTTPTKSTSSNTTIVTKAVSSAVTTA